MNTDQDIWICDIDGDLVVFGADDTVRHRVRSSADPLVERVVREKRTASSEAMAFIREHGRDIREGDDARVLVADLYEALAIPPGSQVLPYFDKLPPDHVFRRFREAMQALQRKDLVWDIRDPAMLETRLDLYRQKVAAAREMLPNMLGLHPLERVPKLRALLPADHRRYTQPADPAAPKPHNIECRDALSVIRDGDVFVGTPHPGEILRSEFMEPLGLSVLDVAKAAGVLEDSIHGVLAGRTFTTALAVRLAIVFGTTAEFWLNLQAGYELRTLLKVYGSTLLQEARPLRSSQRA